MTPPSRDSAVVLQSDKDKVIIWFFGERWRTSKSLRGAVAAASTLGYPLEYVGFDPLELMTVADVTSPADGRFVARARAEVAIKATYLIRERKAVAQLSESVALLTEKRKADPTVNFPPQATEVFRQTLILRLAKRVRALRRTEQALQEHEAIVLLEEWHLKVKEAELVLSGLRQQGKGLYEVMRDYFPTRLEDWETEVEARQGEEALEYHEGMPLEEG